MSEGMARIVALGAGVLLGALIIVVFGTSRLTNWFATAIGTVIGVALYLLLASV